MDRKQLRAACTIGVSQSALLCVRLANSGKVPLEIIQVQPGSYLGKDDIVRFEDAYGRG